MLTSNHPRDILDVTDGIDRVMGDRQLYQRMLQRFRRDYASGALAAERALSMGDYGTAQRWTHTLKGASGMIGALALHAKASAAEQAIRTGAPTQREALTALENEFVRLLPLLDVLLAPPADATVAPRPLLEDRALLVRLGELLQNGDGAAVDLVEECAASLAAILGDAALRQVEAAVNDFDFESALTALKAATMMPPPAAEASARHGL